MSNFSVFYFKYFDEIFCFINFNIDSGVKGGDFGELGDTSSMGLPVGDLLRCKV